MHVASIALLAGGTFASLALSVSAGAGGSLNATLAAAAVYERMFWLVAGVTVATGISNLGLKGEGLLSPDTNWGTMLVVKLSGSFFSCSRCPSFAAIWSSSAAHDPAPAPAASARR